MLSFTMLLFLLTLTTSQCWTLNGFNAKQNMKTPPPPNCDKDEILCEDLRRCIPIFRQCDGQQDCIDNSDEKNCDNKCPGNNFKCNNGKCIETTWVCDSMDDCGDKSDESNCLGLEHLPCSFGNYRCRDGPCISVLKVCDKKRDCPNGDDESRCPQLIIKENNETQMKMNQSYQPSQSDRSTNWQFNPRAPYTMRNSYLSHELQRVLKGLNNETNEQEYDNRTTSYSPYSYSSTTPLFRTFTSTTTSIPVRREPIFYEQYEVDENLQCSDREFKCKDGLRCIPKKDRCDGKLDCVDHSDEEDCNKGLCHYGLFRCVKGKCAISSWKCNASDWSGRRIAIQATDFEGFL